jgi:ABC-type transporter Mla maintaining outer membrane lipid asymmetry ATPase subunit MlaF
MRAPAREGMIEARDLVVGFGDQVVLDRLSITLYRGEILGVVGASGSGKSVLLRTIIGLIPKRAGTVSFLGLRTAPYRARLRAAGAFCSSKERFSLRSRCARTSSSRCGKT